MYHESGAIEIIGRVIDRVDVKIGGADILPWDSEHNRKLIEKMPPVYANPSIDAKLTQAGKTTYLAPTGKGTMFDGEKQFDFASIRDGTSNTILVVESNADREHSCM